MTAYKPILLPEIYDTTLNVSVTPRPIRQGQRLVTLDLLRGIAPEVSRSNLDKILAASSQASVDVLLIGMQAPGNYGPEYKATFDAIYPDLAEQYGALYEQNFFTGIAGETSDPAEMQSYMQDDGIHPNPEGVQQIVEVIGPRVLDLIDRIGIAN